MKKMLASMALGMAAGMAGSYFIYVEYKNGKLSKMLNKVSDTAKDAANKVK